MEERERVISIDGCRYRVAPDPDGVWTHVESESGARVSLRDWTLAEHLDVLERASYWRDGVVRFDDGEFAREVLRRAARGPAASSFEAVALWWALGGVDLNDDDAPVGVTLRRWSWREEVTARERSLETVGRPALYLREMVHASVAESGEGLGAFAGRGGARLLDEVVALNTGEEDEELDARMLDDHARAEQTLWLCSTLGWTPGQVWSAPAIEIERLLRLRERTKPVDRRSRAASTQSALARHPDAVVIEVEGS